MKKLPLIIFLQILLGCAFSFAQVKQTPEVIEAYQVCRQFQQLLAKDFDFSSAYDATFTKNAARRRVIAIYDGEFGSSENLKEISDAILINAYKQRMQIFYLMLALTDSKDKIDSKTLFPPEIEKIFKRKVPQNAPELPEYFRQLERDAAAFRTHFNFLVNRYPEIAASVQKFKTEMLGAKPVPPTDYKVAPNRGYYKSSVLSANEDYYEIDSYVLAREQGKMRIIGIRFFTRLF